MHLSHLLLFSFFFLRICEPDSKQTQTNTDRQTSARTTTWFQLLQNFLLENSINDQIEKTDCDSSLHGDIFLEATTVLVKTVFLSFIFN